MKHKPFKELSKKKKRILFDHWLNTGEIECYDYATQFWHKTTMPSWRIDLCFRVPQVQSPDSIDWTQIAEEYRWMARDINSDTFIFTEKPRETPFGMWHSESAEIAIYANALTSYQQGCVGWKDSLVERPE